MATYQQIGVDIDGEAEFNEFGHSVSMSADGTTFVVGGRTNNGVNGTRSGHVRVYKLNSTINTYTQFGLDIDGEAAGDRFGSSVSISADGQTFVVGATGNDATDSTIFSGHVRVYKFNSTMSTYTQVGVDIDGNTSYDEFGWSVSMSADGTTFVAGATGIIGASEDFAAYVRVYKFNPTIYSYAQVGVDIGGEGAADLFGFSVSMSDDGKTFVVGAPENDAINGAKSGHVRVYKFNSTINRYSQVGLNIDGDAAVDFFGTSVSMSDDGTTFVAGGAGHNGVNGTDSGHVRIYKFNTTINTYTQMGLDIDGEAADDLFGYSVSMSNDGTTFVVGAPLNDGVNGTDSGHVRVYKFNSANNTYAQVGLDIDGEAAGEFFGRSVSMSADGTTFVVGDPFNGGNGFLSGHVRVYTILSPTATPTKQPIKVSINTPTYLPTKAPTRTSTKQPTNFPINTPTDLPTKTPTRAFTKQPAKIPTNTSTKLPTKVPTKSSLKQPTKVPTKSPTITPAPVTAPENCGLFGWNVFCFRRGKCGLLRRLLNLGNCD